MLKGKANVITSFFHLRSCSHTGKIKTFGQNQAVGFDGVHFGPNVCPSIQSLVKLWGKEHPPSMANFPDHLHHITQSFRWSRSAAPVPCTLQSIGWGSTESGPQTAGDTVFPGILLWHCKTKGECGPGSQIQNER